MLNHQKQFAHVKMTGTIGGLFAQFIPDFRRLNNVIGLFPEMHLGEFAVKPAIADDAMLRRRCAGEIIGLRGAGDSGKGGRNVRQRAALAESRDSRRMFADERFGQADDVDDAEAVHEEIMQTKRPNSGNNFR